MAQDLRLEIMLLLLNSDDDISVREIARRLNRPVGHVFYHLKRLYELGILTRNEVDGRVYYSPQKLFTNGIVILNQLCQFIYLRIHICCELLFLVSVQDFLVVVLVDVLK